MRVIAIAYAIRNAQAGYSQANTPALFWGGCYRSRDTHPEAGYSQANTPALFLGGCDRSRDTHPEAGYSQANTPAFALPALFR